jgi:hypothetical protein
MCFPGKPFQPNLMFVSKAKACPRVEHLKGASLGRLITKIRKLQQSKVL